MTFKTPDRPVGVTLDVFESEVLRLMGLHQYAEAYLLLERQTNPSISNLFNMALCLYWSQEYTDCLLVLNRVDYKIPVYSFRQKVMSRRGQRLLIKQMSKESHLNPISEFYVNQFLDILKESILRLKVDCLSALSNWSELLVVASQLSIQEYENVQKALILAQKRTL